MAGVFTTLNLGIYLGSKTLVSMYKVSGITNKQKNPKETKQQNKIKENLLLETEGTYRHPVSAGRDSLRINHQFMNVQDFFPGVKLAASGQK